MSSEHPNPPEEREPEWWSTATPEPHSEFSEAAAYMRDAAEAMRDAATPVPESHWDWSFVGNWLRYRPNGRAFKVAAFTSGPAFGLLLWYYGKSTHADVGAAAFFFALLVSIGHLFFRRQFTRWVMWGAFLGPIFYPPALISLVLYIALLLGGK